MLSGKSDTNKDISSSMEHYLRAIMELKASKGYARSSDIAKNLGVSKPTVSGVVHHLEEHGLVEKDDSRFLHLTHAGECLAARVAGRRKVLMNFLTKVLGLTREQAEQDACGIEHVVSGPTIDRLIDMINFFERENPEKLKELLSFREFRRPCSGKYNCEECDYECDVVLMGKEEIAHILRATADGHMVHHGNKN